MPERKSHEERLRNYLAPYVVLYFIASHGDISPLYNDMPRSLYWIFLGSLAHWYIFDIRYLVFSFLGDVWLYKMASEYGKGKNMH